MKKTLWALTLLLILAAVTSACGGEKGDASTENGDTRRTYVEFSDAEAARALEADWLFLPDGAELLHTMTWDDKLEYDFTAVGYREVNEYIRSLYTAMKEKGFLPLSYRFDPNTCLLTDFAELELPEDAVEDESFSGTAYEFLYKTDKGFYSLSLKYYGSAGGTYGNGKALVTLNDVTDYTARCYEEFLK